MGRFLLAMLGLALLSASFLLAAIPQNITYQGRLTQNGSPVPDGSYEITIAIYDAAAGGTALWNSGAQTVATKSGLFSIRLGSPTGMPFNIFVDTARWVGITVGAGPEMTPRTPFSSTPYSVHALTADNASNVADNSITSAKIANGTIQFGDIGQNGATAGKIIKWTGSAWALANDSVVAGGNVSGFTDNGTQVNLTNSGDTVSLGSVSPKGKLHVQGDLSLSASSAVKFGNDTTKIDEITGDLSIRAKEDISLWPTNDVYIGMLPGNSYVRFDGDSARLGLGTLTIEDKLHVKNVYSGQTSFLRLETSHATNWGETGIRFKTPENTWHLRVDDYTHNNLPNAGSLALRSGDLGSEVMTWLEDGKVGIGTTAPNQKLHVYGNARVKDTLFAGAFGSNVIKASNLIDEPGLSSSFNDLTPHADTVWDTVVSQTIDVPAAGYVLAFATMGLWTMPFSESPIEGSLAISKYPKSLGTSTEWHYHFSDYDQTTAPTTLHEIFTVGGSGNFRYYLLSKSPSISNVTLFWNSKITLLYVPSLYGSIVTAAQFEDEPLLPADASQRTTDQQFKERSQVSKDDFDGLTQEVALLRRTIDSLKQR